VAAVGLALYAFAMPETRAKRPASAETQHGGAAGVPPPLKLATD
jgi:hypothetical protein